MRCGRVRAGLSPLPRSRPIRPAARFRPAPEWVYWFTVVSIWSAVVLTVYSGAIYVWIAYKLSSRTPTPRTHDSAACHIAGRRNVASGDSRGLSGRQRGPMDMDLRALAAGRADHPVGPAAAGSLAGKDVLFIFLIGFASSLMTARSAVDAWMGPDAAQQRPIKQAVNWPIRPNNCSAAGNPGEIAVAVTMAVIVAPLVRGIPLSGLAARLAGSRLEPPAAEASGLRAAPVSWLPIVLPAALFALMHLRSGKEPLSPQYLTGLFLGQMAADSGARPGDHALAVCRGGDGGRSGLEAGKTPLRRQTWPVGPLGRHAAGAGDSSRVDGAGDGTGINYALDPIPLFFLALVLGVLYHRTHRIAPSLVLHMAFNATSVVLFFAGSRVGQTI